MKISVLSTVVSVCLVGLCSGQNAHASIRKDLNVAPESLGVALQEVARVYEFQLLYHTELTADLSSHGASGSLTPDEALTKVLAGTGLAYKYLDTNTVTVYRQPSSRAAGAVGSQSTTDSASSKEAGKTSSQEFRLAQLDQARTGAPIAQSNEHPAQGAVLEEVTVTAQKREERLQDVPVPVTALSASRLADGDQVRLQDYYSQVPGLSLSSGGSGDTELAIRGLSTGLNSNPSVGVTIDDVPYGASTAISNVAIYLPDLDPSDLSRVEVLRGPQGTLYGASSIGGLLKFVTAEPSTDSFSGRVQTDINGVAHGDGAGYGVRGAVNVPLGETLALRMSGFTREDPGYVDNVQTGQHGVNRVDTSGGHFSALWRPSSAFSIKLGALLQNQTADGAANVEPSLGGLRQSMLIGTGTYSTRIRLYTANINADFSGIKIASITGYSVNTVTTLADQTASFGGTGGFADQFYGVAAATGGDNDVRTRKFSQEIRASSTVGRLDWLVGGFYTHESSGSDQLIAAANPDTGAAVGPLADFNFPSRFIEYAGFADLTVHFTDRFDIQLGGRESRNHQVYNETDSGPLAADVYFPGYPSPLVYPTIETTTNAFTYLATPRYRVSDDLMVYARFASGYRPGGPNADASLFGFPSKVDPDKARNYEIGLKADTLERRLSFDASVYYIDWNNLQIGLTDAATGFAFLANAASAKSEGVELSVQARPLEGLQLAGWVAWNEAILTSDLPATASAVGASGDRLPYSSRFSGSFSVQDDFHLTGRLQGFAGAAASFVGDRKADFVPTYYVGSRPELPAYARIDLHAGVRYDTWTANLFINNVADKRGVVSVNPLIANPTIYIRPRTIGLSVTKTF